VTDQMTAARGRGSTIGTAPSAGTVLPLDGTGFDGMPAPVTPVDSAARLPGFGRDCRDCRD